MAMELTPEQQARADRSRDRYDRNMQARIERLEKRRLERLKAEQAAALEAQREAATMRRDKQQNREARTNAVQRANLSLGAANADTQNQQKLNEQQRRTVRQRDQLLNEQEMLQEASQMAQELSQMDDARRRSQLERLERDNLLKYCAVRYLLDQINEQMLAAQKAEMTQPASG